MTRPNGIWSYDFVVHFRASAVKNALINSYVFVLQVNKNISESVGEFTETWDQYQNQPLKSSIPIPSELRLKLWS